VYKHVRGWAAVRPPEDSFSWVAAEFIEPIDGATGVVVGRRVVSRVGSQFEEQRDVIQVFLDNGEEVDLLDPEPFPDATEERDWYMIAPPAGEFRWVRLSDLASDQPSSMIGPSLSAEPRRFEADEPFGYADTPAPAGRTLEYDSADEQYPNDQYPNYRVSGRQDGSSVATSDYAQRSAESYDVETTGRSPLVRPPRPESTSALPASVAPQPASRQSGSRWKDYRESLSDDVAPSGPIDTHHVGIPSASPHDVSGRGGYVSYVDQLDEIELEIATMVAKDPTYWSFAPARAQLTGVMTRADTAVERGRAQSLSGKIDRLDELKGQYMNVVRGRGQSSTDSLVASERASSFDDSRTIERSAAATGGEVTGLLRPVVSKRPDAPAYALMDDEGQVRTFVSESPGVELRDYVGRRVGVTGPLGYVPELRADHVTARRVAIVDQPLRR
jgi:hypothetical protein